MNEMIKKLVRKAIPRFIIIQKLNNNAGHHLLLTFDDGPHEKLTPKVLSLLSQFNARVIFFVAGKYVKKYPYLLSEIKKRGHLIGNHTYNHPNPRIITFSEYMNELGSCQNIISKITGEKPKYFRPTKGLISLKGLLTAKKLELKTVLWSIQAGEWGLHYKHDAKTIASHLLRNVKSRDIILLHDDNEKTLEVLKIILPALTQRNYELFKSIDYI